MIMLNKHDLIKIRKSVDELFKIKDVTHINLELFNDSDSSIVLDVYKLKKDSK